MNSNTINKVENLFRPLNSYLKNNTDLSEEAVALVSAFVEGVVVKHYDSSYAQEVYAYARDQLISEQVSMVMEVVGR